MTRDFGGRDRPTWRAGRRLELISYLGTKGGLFLGVLLFAVLPTAVAISPIGPELLGAKHRPFRARACQPISEPAFDRGWKEAPRSFTFLGAKFARRRGDADCQGRKAVFGKVWWPVCEFDVPFQLAVTRGGHTIYYAVPPGFTAIVDARPATPTRCFVTGPNTLPLTLSSEAGAS